MEAFGELYRRHAEAAWRVAIAVTGNRHDASDAVAEAFSRVLRAIPARRLEQTGRFRPYLLSATRNAGVDILRRKGRLTLTDPTNGPEPAAPAPGPWEELEAGEDAGMVGTAFRSLPERWRSVLWLTEVEGMPAREVGELLGLSANGVAQLAVRARAGLRQRYLQAHLRADTISEGCRPAVSLLGAYVAGALSARETARVDGHLAACSSCRARVAELEELGPALRRILIPLPIGLAEVARAHFGLGPAGMVAPHASTALSRVLRIGQTAHRPLASASAGMLAIGLAGAALAIYRGPAGPGSALPPGPAGPGGPGASARAPTSLTGAISPHHGGVPSATGPGSPGGSTSGSPPTQATSPGAASSSSGPSGSGSTATPVSPATAASAGTTTATSGAGPSGSSSGSAATSSSGTPAGGAGTSGGASAPTPTPGPIAQVNAQVGPVSASLGVSASSAPGTVAQVNAQVGPVSASVGVGAGSCTGVAVGSVSVGCSGAGSSGTGQTSAQSSVPVSATATVNAPLPSAVSAVTTTVSQAGAQVSEATGDLGSALNQLGQPGG
jgi:RNA polymerase sigma factor (sigma-70 family)